MNKNLTARTTSITAILASLAVCFLNAGNASAANTPVGTNINNRAAVSYLVSGTTHTMQSNINTVTVDSYTSSIVQANKTVTVVDQWGGNQPIPGATLRYTIIVTASGSGTAGNVVIADPVPSHTVFLSGTLRLNNAALTDAVDADVGDAGGTTPDTVTIRLGNLTAATPAQTITFEVRIK